MIIECHICILAYTSIAFRVASIIANVVAFIALLSLARDMKEAAQ